MPLRAKTMNNMAWKAHTARDVCDLGSHFDTRSTVAHKADDSACSTVLEGKVMERASEGACSAIEDEQRNVVAQISRWFPSIDLHVCVVLWMIKSVHDDVV